MRNNRVVIKAVAFTPYLERYRGIILHGSISGP